MQSQAAVDMLKALAATANGGDYEKHMALISPDVQVFGVPGFEVIGHEDWARQCRHEFENGLLRQVSYEGLKVLAETASSVLFKTVETVEGSDGTVNCHGVEILIRKGTDGLWRVTQERVLDSAELAHDRDHGL